MNEELQQALADIILRATDTAGAAKDFVLAEMPDVIQQLLMWKLAESIVHNLLPLLLLLSLPLLKRLTAWARAAYDNGEEWTRHMGCTGVTSIPYDFVRAAPYVAGMVWALVTAIFVNLTWLQILIAPKIYLIEYAARLVK